MLKARIFVDESTDVEQEVQTLATLAEKHLLDEMTTSALLQEARVLLVDFRQTATEAARGHFSAEITKTLKGLKYEIAFVLGQEPKQKAGGIMRLFKRL